MLKWWPWKPRLTTADSEGRQLPSLSDDLPSLPNAGRRLTRSERSAVARRVVTGRKRLHPKDGSVAAFVAWVQADGQAGRWLQIDLYAAYEAACNIAGYHCLPLKKFKRALQKAGCRCWQDDCHLNGKRWRPEAVEVPNADTSLPAGAAEDENRVLPLPVRVMGTQRPFASRHGQKRPAFARDRQGGDVAKAA